MLPQGAMNSVSPTKRVRDLVFDVMRSHDGKIKKDEALDRARDRITHWACPPGCWTRTRTSCPVA